MLFIAFMYLLLCDCLLVIWAVYVYANWGWLAVCLFRVVWQIKSYFRSCLLSLILTLNLYLLVCRTKPLYCESSISWVLLSIHYALVAIHEICKILFKEMLIETNCSTQPLFSWVCPLKVKIVLYSLISFYSYWDHGSCTKILCGWKLEDERFKKINWWTCQVAKWEGH